MKEYFSFFLLLLIPGFVIAQLAEVQANYNSMGDVDFVAYNNTRVPLFLNIDFADLENTTFNEPLPYIRLLQPGFNTLFTLQRDNQSGVPRFNHQIKIFKSNPWSLGDLDFPYLIPLSPGKTALIIDVQSLAGFLDMKVPESWSATGFLVAPGQDVYASRTGIIVEVTGASRHGDSQTWYHHWNNAITLLQADGTLICYRNIVDSDKKLKIGEKLFAGQKLGNVVPSANELIIVIYQHSLNSPELRFIIPQFVSNNDTGVLLTSQEYQVVHPREIRAKEMTSRERRRYLK